MDPENRRRRASLQRRRHEPEAPLVRIHRRRRPNIRRRSPSRHRPERLRQRRTESRQHQMAARSLRKRERPLGTGSPSRRHRLRRRNWTLPFRNGLCQPAGKRNRRQSPKRRTVPDHPAPSSPDQTKPERRSLTKTAALAAIKTTIPQNPYPKTQEN